MDSLLDKSDEAGSARLDRGLAVWEIVSVVTSCLIAEWVVLVFLGASKLIAAIPVLLAITLMVFSHLSRRETFGDVGFRTDNLVPAIRFLALPTAVALMLIIATAYFSHHSLIIAPWRNRFLALPLWALFQQYALNGFINRRSQIAFGKGTVSIMIVGIVFGLIHLPNPLLAMLTMVGGFVWGAAYQRHPNLFVLAISHSLLSIALALTVSPNLLNNLRVGFKYFG